MTAALRFSVQTPIEGTTFAALARHWQRAEELGYDSAWLDDHFYGVATPPSDDSLECWTLMAALARETSRLRFGALVMCNSYRHPPLLAKMAGTLDHISDGRLEFGLGAGWYEHEYRAYGYDFPAIGTRLEQLEEALQICTAMWTRGARDVQRAPLPGRASPNLTARLPSLSTWVVLATRNLFAWCIGRGIVNSAEMTYVRCSGTQLSKGGTAAADDKSVVAFDDRGNASPPSVGFAVAACFLAVATAHPTIASQVRAQQPKASPPNDERNKERDRFEKEAHERRQQGKTTEAIAAGKSCLPSNARCWERACQHAQFTGVAGGAMPLLMTSTRREYRLEILATKTKLYGPKHWQVTDAEFSGVRHQESGEAWSRRSETAD